MPRKQSAPLDLTVKVATALPLAHRLGFPCIGCGSPVEPGHVYYPSCQLDADYLELFPLFMFVAVGAAA